MTPGENKQHIFPLFGLAFGLAALGLYLGVTDQPQPPEIDEQSRLPRISFEPPSDLQNKTDDSRAVRLSYSVGQTRRVTLGLEQKNTRSGRDSSLATNIELSLREHTKKTDKGLRSSRHIEAARVRVQEAGKPIAPNVNRQLQKNLPGTVLTHTFESNGRTRQIRWKAVNNPQLERTLALIKSTAELLTPRFQRGAVMPGDTWEYRIPHQLGSDQLEMEGSLTVQNELLGTYTTSSDDKLAVIRQNHEVTSRGRVDAGGDRPATQSEVSGTGRSTIYFDVNAGAVRYQELEFKATFNFEESEQKHSQSTTIRIRQASEPAETG